MPGPSKPAAKQQQSSDISQYGGGTTKKDVFQTPPPTAEEVEHFHSNADVDTRPESMHHSLGGAPNQAASGNHVHNGTDSPLLLDGVIITGSKTDGTAVASILAALQKFGIQDQTS